MRRTILSSLILLLTLAMTAQNIEVLYENDEYDVLVYANNPHVCPVSVKLDLQLKNMKSDRPKDQIVVLPASKKRTLLARLSSIDPYKPGNYHVQFEAKYGDVKNATHDALHIYELPYQEGSTVAVHQGYNGRFSHSGVKALDFNMTVGTPIHAARSGIVIKVEDRNSRGCNSPSCHKYNNMVVILHSDGSMAVYSHLQRKGAKVTEGQRVEAGDLIALSGKTGYASGPHLHFMVVLPRFGNNKTVATQFRTLRNGNAQLAEKKEYTRPY